MRGVGVADGTPLAGTPSRGVPCAGCLSGSGGALGRSFVGPNDLVHEPGLLQSQSEYRDPQHSAPGQHEFVLAQGVEHGTECFEVVSAVYLDDEVQIVPAHVEVGATTRQNSERLAARRRESMSAAEPGEVQLTERSDAVADVLQDTGDDAPTGAPAEGAKGRKQLLGSDYSLAHHENEDQCSHAIGRRPLGGMQGRVVGTDSWDSTLNDGRHGLVVVRTHPLDPVATVVRGLGDVDHVVLETVESARLKSCDSIQDRSGARLPHRMEPSSPSRP